MERMEPRFEFVLMGEAFEARAGTVAVDVGSKCVPGVIDHHFAGAGQDCAATLVARRGQELVLDYLSDLPSETLTIRMHREPDLDCVVSAFLVQLLVTRGSLPKGAEALADYAQIVDAGQPPPDGLGPTSLWALYAAVTQLTPPASSSDEDHDAAYTARVLRGFDLLRTVMEQAPATVLSIALPDKLPGWEKEQTFLADDQRRYAEDRRCGHKLRLTLPAPGATTRKVRGLRVTDPRSAMFKHFARAEGFLLTHVIYTVMPEAGSANQPARHVISVAPDRGIWLRGLGPALEGAEVLARAKLGHVRPGPPRWEDVTNNDPWYDGRSALHGYTIVDTPRNGTVLTTEEVCAVLRNTRAWIRRGRPPQTKICPEGCRVPNSLDDAYYCPRHGTKLVPAVVDGRYEVMALLGQGGMGIVYEVRDRRTTQTFALKHLLGTLLQDEQAWQIFLREARMANRIGHPNVVRLCDSGADPTAGLYTISEVVKGIELGDDISAWADRGKPYPWPRFCSVVVQICEALAAVHHAGVLHRDLKPANILLQDQEPGSDDPDPIVKVLDFGIAILSDPEATRLTVPGGFRGTPLYAAPEQFQSHDIDERTDLYALGAIMYHMLSGEPAHQNCDSFVRLAAAKCMEPVPHFLLRHPVLDANPSVERLLACLLDSKPSRRPPSAEEVQKQVARWLG